MAAKSGAGHSEHLRRLLFNYNASTMPFHHMKSTSIRPVILLYAHLPLQHLNGSDYSAAGISV
jgi:hypothetical protein